MRRLLLRVGFVAIVFASGGCDRGPRTPLAEAAVRNDVATLRRLIREGHEVDDAGDAWTPLIWAARSGSAEAIDALVRAGADVNLPGPTDDGWNATPLQHAILARQPAAAERLLDLGADPNRGAGPGSAAPLLLAAGDTDPAIVQLLIAHSADPDVQDERGATPLARAVAAGTLHGPDNPMFGGCRTETVRTLVAHDPALRHKGTQAWDDAVWWVRFQRCTDVLTLIGE